MNQRSSTSGSRRVYKATEAGKRALADDRRALKELAREVLGNDAP